MAEQFLRIGGTDGSVARSLKTDKSGSLRVRNDLEVSFPTPVEIQTTLSSDFPNNVFDFQHTNDKKAIIIESLIVSASKSLYVLIEPFDYNGQRRLIKIPRKNFKLVGTPTAGDIQNGLHPYFEMVDYVEDELYIFKLTAPLRFPFGGRIRLQKPTNQPNIEIAGVMTYRVLED